MANNKREHHHVSSLITRSTTSERPADPGAMVGVAEGPGCRGTEEKAQCYLGRLFQVCWWWGKNRVESGAGVEAPNFSREPEQGTATMVVIWPRPFKKCSSRLLGSGRCTSDFRREYFGCSVDILQSKRKGMFESNVSDPVLTHTEILPGSKWSVLLVRNVIRDAMRSAFCVFPNEGFTLMSIHTIVDDMKPFLKGISFDVPDSTRELHEPFGTEMKKCLSRIQSVRVIMKARARWMSLTRI